MTAVFLLKPALKGQDSLPENISARHYARLFRGGIVLRRRQSGSELFAGVCTAVVAPARGTKNVQQFFAQADFFSHVPEDILPFVKNDAHRVGAFDGFGQAVADRLVLFVLQFGLERAETASPDDQQHRRAPPHALRLQ